MYTMDFLSEINNLILSYLKGTDQAGTFMSLKCVVYYANYRSWHQSSKIQVVSYPGKNGLHIMYKSVQAF